MKDAVINDQDAINAKRSWELVTNDTCEEFVKMKAAGGAKSSCLAWFYDTFYDRLFDVHPSSRALFRGNMTLQGKALVHMITGALSLLDNLPKLVDALHSLAKTHNTKGVLATQYGIVGEVLLWTFSRILGPQFDEATKMAWLKIYSVMLSVIIPVAIEQEKSAIETKTKEDAKSSRRRPKVAVTDTEVTKTTASND